MNTTADFAGSLEFMGLADIIQLLGGIGSTGILRLESPFTPDIGVVYFQEGNPIDAINGSAKGQDALYSMFGWTKGDFNFRLDSFKRDRAIKQGRMEIILDGLRMLDDGEIPKLGPPVKDSDKAGKTRDGLPVIKGPLVDYMYVVDEESYSDGQDIVIEGKHGAWIWVILEGVVDVIRHTSDGEIKLLTLGDGAFVGSFESFLMKGSVRSATIRASSKVQMGVLDTQRMSIDFTRMSHQFKDIILSLDRRLKRLSDNLVAVKQKHGNIHDQLKGKTPVVTQGQEEDRLLLITQGEACVVRRTQDGDVPLALLKKNDVFGSLPFRDVGNEPNSASVYGSEDLKVSKISVDELKAEFDHLNQTYKNIVEALANSIAATTQLLCSAVSQK